MHVIWLPLVVVGCLHYDGGVCTAGLEFDEVAVPHECVETHHPLLDR